MILPPWRPNRKTSSPFHPGNNLSNSRQKNPGDQEGKSTVIRAAGQYEVIAENQLDDGCMASPAVSGNAIFLRTRGIIFSGWQETQFQFRWLSFV